MNTNHSKVNAVGGRGGGGGRKRTKDLHWYGEKEAEDGWFAVLGETRE